MAGNKKPRKAHKPKYICRNVLTTIFGGMSGTHGDHLSDVLVHNAAAMQALVQGRGKRDDWERVVGAINIANIMIEQGIGREYMPQMAAARQAMIDMGKRFVTTGKFLFKGDELKIVNEALDIHIAQLENTRSIDVDKAASEVERRIKYRINSTNVVRELAMDKLKKEAA